MVMDLTGMVIANASLDEGTAAVVDGSRGQGQEGKETAGLERLPPQTIDVRVRCRGARVEVVVADEKGLQVGADAFAVVVQYPATDGGVHDYRALADSAHASDAMVVAATDLLALTLLAPPGEWGADVVVGNSQRFGVPLGYGGPHAAFFATKDEYKRVMPGRIIGVSRDTAGKPALRMALQTREQHIRREKATSNVCTAQVLLAVIAGMYAVWHGPDGLTRIAKRVHKLAASLAAALERAGHKVRHDVFFDTICVEPNGKSAEEIVRAARDRSINLRDDGKTVCIAFDETSPLPTSPRCSRRSASRARRRRARDGDRRSLRRAICSHERVPDAPGLPQPPLRDRDAALHAYARVSRLLARARHDPAARAP